MPLSLDELPLATNPALFGSQRSPGLVSARETPQGLELFVRRRGQLEVESVTFEPFLWLADPALLQGLKAEHRLQELEGEGFFTHLVRCPDYAQLKKVSQHLAKGAALAPNHPRSPQLFLADPVHQYLLDSGRTMFNGMAFEDLHRLQLHLYADVPLGFDFSASARDPILVLGMSDSTGWETVLTAQVTARGREVLTRMIDWLRGHGATILEVDTDGIYFTPTHRGGCAAPPGTPPPGPLPADWLAQLNADLPEAIQVELDGRYPAMFCHKMKNYALLEEDGSLTLRGSGLRSRSLEPYLREVLEAMLERALKGHCDQIPDLLAFWRERLSQRQVSVGKLARTEILADPPWIYRKKIEAGSRNRAAVYELALQSGRRYVAGDSITYYITGSRAQVTAYDHARAVAEHDEAAPDENTAYYLKKLDELGKKFLPLLQIEL